MLVYTPIIFLIIAILYSSIGFGGGSSYIALMLISGISYQHIPVIALICNLIVVTGSSYHYIRNKHINWAFLLPFIISSTPMSFIGGSIPIEQKTFKLILGGCLLLSSLKMLITKKAKYSNHKLPPKIFALILGAFIGLISGLVGIGGGIFLSPILYNLKWGKPKEIASICCLFIFFNSISGLSAQLSKVENFQFFNSYWSLALCVLVGGQIGSYIGVNKLQSKLIEIMTAILVLFVSLRILFLS